MKIQIPLRCRQGTLVLTPGRLVSSHTKGHSVKLTQVDEAGKEITVITLSGDDVTDMRRAFDLLS